MPSTTLGLRYEFANFVVYPTGRRVLRNGEAVALTARAFDLLVALVERAGTLVDKDELLRQAWPRMVVEENALQVQVSALRKIIGADSIVTVSRHGYRFDVAVSRYPLAAVGHADANIHNLSEPTSTFIGREAEIARIKRKLERSPLVSLVGAGGCGKSRLALRVARELVGTYSDGVWVLELASVADPAHLPRALADALRLPGHADATLMPTVVTHLSARECLIVLDNAQRLLPAVRALVAPLLLQCPHVKLLVTGRQRLAIPGESAYRVPSLSVPDPQRDTRAVRVAPFEATRLLVDRIRLQRPHFAVTDENASALCSICCRFDGIPLAIELAAPWARTMTVVEIDRSLDEGLPLRSGGGVGPRNRQRILRAALDWSHDSLTSAEQTLWRRLSIFPGHWFLRDAESVCTDQQLSADSVLDLLMSLADKSLIVVHELNSEECFGMLPTVREYAYERLGKAEVTPLRWLEKLRDYERSRTGDCETRPLDTARAVSRG